MIPRPDRRRRKKQPTRPKIRGCYNCSQRRISCDRETPQCHKCVKSGLSCSGLGPRIRFADGIASRGKFKGQPVPLPVANPTNAVGLGTESGREYSSSDQEPNPASEVSSPASPVIIIDDRTYPQFTIHYSLDHINGHDRYLLTHYAEKVAPVMVTIDKPFNGYRDLILPMSETCPMLLNAALAAAAHHITVQHDSFRESAPRYYTTAIRGLMQSSNGEPPSLEMATNTIATILLLLICDLIAADNDFPILFRLLERLVEMAGGADKLRKGDAGIFLMQQVQKLTFYATPFLPAPTTTTSSSSHPFCTSHPTNPTSSSIPSALESLHAQQRQNPEHTPIFTRLITLISLAQTIYTSRALNSLPSASMQHLVRRFLATAGDIPVLSPGGHSLVWAYFIVAAESREEAHRAFFVRKLEELWRDTGFRNARVAVGELGRIWGLQGKERWTVALPGLVRTFVM